VAAQAHDGLHLCIREDFIRCNPGSDGRPFLDVWCVSLPGGMWKSCHMHLGALHAAATTLLAEELCQACYACALRKEPPSCFNALAGAVMTLTAPGAFHIGPLAPASALSRFKHASANFQPRGAANYPHLIHGGVPGVEAATGAEAARVRVLAAAAHHRPAGAR
jgi:hypothetical protein